MVRGLDSAIREAHPGFDVAIKYNLLMYAIASDWRHWVVAIDAHPKRGVGLRFLYGVMLGDPKKVLRAGSSVLKTWDIESGAAIDRETVMAYVKEAAERYPEFRANDKEILAGARSRQK